MSTCAICHEAVEVLNCLTMCCRQSYHYTCIASWLNCKTICPICHLPLDQSVMDRMMHIHEVIQDLNSYYQQNGFTSPIPIPPLTPVFSDYDMDEYELHGDPVPSEYLVDFINEDVVIDLNDDVMVNLLTYVHQPSRPREPSCMDIRDLTFYNPYLIIVVIVFAMWCIGAVMSHMESSRTQH